MRAEEAFKEEITGVIKEFFGDEAAKMMQEYYESDKPAEIVKATFKMLSDFMGEENSRILIERILKRFPNIKVEAVEVVR